MVKKREQSTIDEYFQGYDKTSIDDAFKHYDTYTKPEIISGVNNKINDGMHDFYSAFKKSLEGSIGKDLHVGFKKKKKEVKSAKLEGLKAFFETVNPDLLKHHMEHAKDDNKLYEDLMIIYDKHTLQFDPDQKSGDMSRGLYSLNVMMKSGEQNKDYTVEQFKNDLYKQTAKHANKIAENLVFGKATEKFKSLSEHDVARYVHKEVVGKKGHDVDMGQFYQHGVQDLISIRNHFLKGTELEGSYKQKHIIIKKDKKK